MTGIWVPVAAAVAFLVAAGFAVARRAGGRRSAVAETVISTGPDSCTEDERSGAVRSLQTADLFLPAAAVEEIWTPVYLERLARTYWRYLSRVTLGLIRVCYTERERYVVLLSKRLKLITFQAPEYEMDATRGLVRWRIARGLLVARRGRDLGYLQIEVCRRPVQPGAQRAKLHVAVEVANFYPAIAFGLSRWIYDATQSHIHVLITHGFLRSLARLDLAESRTGRLAPRAAPEQGG
jgi:hypothetical protein